MAFDAVLVQVLDLLQRKAGPRSGRCAAVALAALMQQLVATQLGTVDEVGACLVWQGELRPAAALMQIWDMVPSAPGPRGRPCWETSIRPLVSMELVLPWLAV